MIYIGEEYSQILPFPRKNFQRSLFIYVCQKYLLSTLPRKNLQRSSYIWEEQRLLWYTSIFQKERYLFLRDFYLLSRTEVTSKYFRFGYYKRTIRRNIYKYNFQTSKYVHFPGGTPKDLYLLEKNTTHK